MREGLNKVLLIGNIGKINDLKKFDNNHLLNFSIATTERFKDKNGDWKDKTDWHNIALWGKRAESLNNILEKGMPLFIEGKIQTRSYDDREGNKRYITEVVARDIKLLGSKGDSGSRSAPENDDPGFDESDIPF